MIYNKFIVCGTNETFEASLAAGDIVDQHIVFIEETGKIWTNGKMYGGADVNELPNATEAIKGLIAVGANITVIDGVISLTSQDVENALGFIPLSASANSTVPEVGSTTTDMAVKALQDWDGDDIRDTKFKVNTIMSIIDGDEDGLTGLSELNVIAVETTEGNVDDANQEYVTKGEFDATIGDINSILDELNGEVV